MWKIQEYFEDYGQPFKEKDYFRVVPKSCPDDRDTGEGFYRSGGYDDNPVYAFAGWEDRDDMGLFDTPEKAKEYIYSMYPEEDAWFLVSVEIIKSC